jgi:hypothetical protein
MGDLRAAMSGPSRDTDHKGEMRSSIARGLRQRGSLRISSQALNQPLKPLHRQNEYIYDVCCKLRSIRMREYWIS